MQLTQKTRTQLGQVQNLSRLFGYGLIVVAVLGLARLSYIYFKKYLKNSWIRQNCYVRNGYKKWD